LSFNQLIATRALFVSRLHLLLVDQIAHLFVFFVFFVFLFFLALFPLFPLFFLLFLFVFLPPFATPFRPFQQRSKRQTLAAAIAAAAHVFPLVFGACACFYVDLFTSDFFFAAKASVFFYYFFLRQDKTRQLVMASRHFLCSNAPCFV